MKVFLVRAIRLAFTALPLAAIVLFAACAPATSFPTAYPVVVEPATQEPAAVTGADTAQPASTPTSPSTSPVTAAPGAPMLPGEKPSWNLSDKRPVNSIAFVLPGGTVALKLGPVGALEQNPNGLFDVAVVEIAPGDLKLPDTTFVISLDLESKDSPVGGRLASPSGHFDQALTFTRTQLKINPDRFKDLPGPELINAAITSDGVCLSIEYPMNTGNFWRYCSQPGSPLSIKANFGQQYSSQSIGQISAAIEKLSSAKYLADQKFDANMTVSEMEDPNNITTCQSDSKNCGADITAAPVSSFWKDYHAALANAKGDKFSVIAGALRVNRLLQFSSNNRLYPGDYVIYYWFDQDGKELGATVSGLMDQDTNQKTPVLNQQIPAAPSLFINAENPEEVVTQVSGLKFFRMCCLWQVKCP